MKRKIALFAAGSLMALATTASAANKAETFTLSPVIGGIGFDGDQGLEARPLYGLRAGYNFTKRLGIEALFDYANTQGESGGDVDFFRYGGDLLYHMMPDNKFVPYLAAGYSGSTFKGTPDFARTTNRGMFDYGVGAKYFLSDNVAMRADVRGLLYSIGDNTMNGIEGTAGVLFAFGGEKPAAKPLPAPVAKVEPPADSDGDGVIDSLDKCPGTPAGVKVDASGCPLDSDKDGVADYLDKCPGTPAGVTVDANGCPLDSDKDGVADYLDKCPGTPAGVKVDANGCPLDSDKDGVADYLDKCPNTPAGVKVDKDGCPPPAVVKYCSQPAVVTVTFGVDKADINTKYDSDLKALGGFLKEYTKAKGEISGHTDNTGSKVYNQKLSERRADSVKKYLTEKFGVDGQRITTKGYGEDKPVADNKTAEGRAQNRRIETNFTCE